MTEKLTRDDLYSLEEYHSVRNDFRKRVMNEKKRRVIQVGPHVTLHFENRLIMQYQVQEMLRVERIFEAEGIQEELDAYNPLIPDGQNWKATMMIEYDDPEERKVALAGLIGIEDRTWVQVEGHDRVYPVCDEDLERSDEIKTSSVHFMRFELTPEMISAARNGAGIRIGIDHPSYLFTIDSLPDDSRQSLLEDLA